MIRIIILEVGGLIDCFGLVILVEMNICCILEVDVFNKNNIS